MSRTLHLYLTRREHPAVLYPVPYPYRSRTGSRNGSVAAVKAVSALCMYVGKVMHTCTCLTELCKSRVLTRNGQPLDSVIDPEKEYQWSFIPLIPDTSNPDPNLAYRVECHLIPAD